MKKLLIVILSLLNLNLHAQERESRDLAAFTGIRAAEGIDVYVKKGSKHLAEIVASGVSTSSIITDVSGGTLRIHMREGTYRSRSVKVYVTYVELEKLMASSGANIFTEDIIKSTKMHMS
ncbi:MAG TPA: DUF2807 domain-containing protein, partial [Cyclobacteriaceae bacterium]|nr:DUF2807 domain-containing protein [Cyclobacteriaceae bacterium]